MDGAELRSIAELSSWSNRSHGGSDIVVMFCQDGTVVFCCFFGEVELEGWCFEGWVLMLEYGGDGLGLSPVCIVECFVCVLTPMGDGVVAYCACGLVPVVLSV